MINLKDLFKCVALFVVGVIVAVFVYPILHELGHALSAIAFGVKIKDVSLFPLPSVLCEFNGQSSIVIAFIGFCGILVPSVITFLYVPNNFWFWYVWLMMKCITMLSFIIACVAIVMFVADKPIIDEDMTWMLIYVPEYAIQYFILLIFLEIASALQIKNTKPLKRCMEEFNL